MDVYIHVINIKRKSIPKSKSLVGQNDNGIPTKNMVILSKFQLKYNKDEDVYYVITDEESFCPICFSALIKKGWRKRDLIQPDESLMTLRIQRLRCNICIKTHHELPDIIVPYKRHCSETIENIINGKIDDACCLDCTIYKIKAWWVCLQLYIEGIKASLSEKHKIDMMAIKKVKDIVRILANTHSWPRYPFGNDVRAGAG